MALKHLEVPAPYSGRYEIDATSEAFPDDAASDLLNYRPSRRTWLPRLGLSYWVAQIGSNAPRYLATHHDGTARVRLFARGASGSVVLYDYVEGVDSVFHGMLTGGTGLNGDFFQSVQIGTITYITDRKSTNTIYSYQHTVNTTTTGALALVALPTAPTVAPLCVPWTAAVLEDWSNPAGWTASAAGQFSVAASTKNNPLENPLSANSVLFTIGTSSDNETIAKSGAAISTLSNSVAFWIKQTNIDFIVAYQLGVAHHGEFAQHINPGKKNQWEPIFFPYSLLTLSYQRFKVLNQPATGQTLLMSPLVLPGQLDGKYLYRYTALGSNGRESAPGPVVGAVSATPEVGTPVDLSTKGQNNINSTATAMKKSTMITFTASGVAGQQHVLYRLGGVPEFTVDDVGNPVWCRIATINDVQTALTNSPIAGDTSFTVTSATGMAVGDWLVVDKGTTSGGALIQEFVKILSFSGGGGLTVNFTTVAGSTSPIGFLYGHSSGADKVQIAYLDNTPDSALATALRLEIERYNPPNEVKWLAKAADGRMWVQYGKNGMAVSNKPTTMRPYDHEVFPSGVDPVTRRHPTQGWRFSVESDDAGDAIMWFGFFHSIPTILTRNGLHQVFAQSQTNWSSTAVKKRFNFGCIEGRTVTEVGGYLYWVAEGPRVMRWDGSNPPEDISAFRIGELLKATSSTYWTLWHAVSHVKNSQAYYCLWLVKASEIVPNYGLQFNTATSAWEPVQYTNAADGAMQINVAHTLKSVGDSELLYVASVNETNILSLDVTGQTGDALTSGLTKTVAVSATSKRFKLPVVCQIEHVFIRGPGATDSLTFTLKTGGTEYGDITTVYPAFSTAGSGDQEEWFRGPDEQKGRWVEFKIAGSLSNQATIREIEGHWSPVRLLQAGG